MRIALIIFFSAIVVGVVIGFINFFTGGERGDFERPITVKGPASDGGIYRSLNGGEDFEQFALAGGEVDISRVDISALFEDPEQNGLWWIATMGAGLFVWEEPSKAPLAVDEEAVEEEPQTEPDWLPVWGQEEILRSSTIRGIARTQDGGLLLALDFDKRGRIWKSEDGGATFRETFSSANDKVLVTTLAVSPVNKLRVLAGLSDGLLIQSLDGGETWSSLTTFNDVIALLTFGRNSDTTVYGSLVAQGMIRSLDGGATFENLSKLRLTRDDPAFEQALSRYTGSRTILSIALHPTDPNQLLIATAGGLLRTRDQGTHWELLPVPLRPEALPVQSVAYDPQNPRTLYTTAGDGLYTSFDDGANWRITRFSIRPALSLLAVSRQDGEMVLLGTTDK